jgi:hypothetical protein
VPQHVPPGITVLAGKPAVALGDMPVPPAGFGVVDRVQPCPRAARQADEPGNTDAAGIAYPAGHAGSEATA